MAKKGGSKDSYVRDSSVSVPTESKPNTESNKQKVAKLHDMFPNASKDMIVKILQYYDDDFESAINAITSDGGAEALSNWAEVGSLKNKNNKNKKKKKKNKKEMGAGAAGANLDADDSSSLHSNCNVDLEAEKECVKPENRNGTLGDNPDAKSSEDTLASQERFGSSPDVSLSNDELKSSSSSSKLDQKSVPESEVPSAHEEASKNSGQQDEKNMLGSPVSDSSERHSDQTRDKYRSNRDDAHYKYISRQRTGSFHSSKTSSFSEEPSSHNAQASAAPTKRGYDKCRKDLNRQTVSLQRIEVQLEKGLEEASKRLKNTFVEVRRMLDKRQELVEQEMQKTKLEALNLLKSRQDLATELKRRVDRTAALSETEWSELRSDIKQYVTERKYDDELGKTIWYCWGMEAITESINNFGEVHAVKNVYSQRSHSLLSNASSSQVNAEPSPSSSLTNEEINSTADKNDVASISDAVEETPPAEKVSQDGAPVFRGQTQGSRVFSNKNFGYQPHYGGARYPNQNNRGRGFFRGGRGGFPRQKYNYRNNYGNYDHSGEYRNHPHQDRGGNENVPFNEKSMGNNPRDNRMNDRNPRRGQHMNYRSGNSGRYRHAMNQRQNVNADNVSKAEPTTAVAPVPSESVSNEKPNVVNGYVNN